MAADFPATNAVLSDPGAADLRRTADLIEAWTDSVRPLGAGGAPIVADLYALKSALTAPRPDGGEIARLLSSLGQATTAHAGVNTDLLELGRRLSELGAAND